MAHTRQPSLWEAEAEGSQVQTQVTLSYFSKTLSQNSTKNQSSQSLSTPSAPQNFRLCTTLSSWYLLLPSRPSLRGNCPWVELLLADSDVFRLINAH